MFLERERETKAALRITSHTTRRTTTTTERKRERECLLRELLETLRERKRGFFSSSLKQLSFTFEIFFREHKVQRNTI